MTDMKVPASQVTATSQVLDQAEIFLQENQFSPSDLQELLQDEACNKKLVRRIDLTLMPLLCGTYLLQYIDKQALSYAAVFDLFSSTGTTPAQYSWLASAFYFGVLIMEWPASYLAQHLPMGKVISSFIVIWGSILMLTAACVSFPGLAVCRTLLGCFEAPITPIFLMILATWYTRSEQPLRAGLFYSFNGLGEILGGLLFYGIGQEKSSFPVWRAMMLLCGGLTIIWGVVMMVFLPSDITTARRFSVTEKAALIARSKTNLTGVYSRTIKTSQIWEALIDAQVWMLFFFVLLNEIINGGFSSFGKLIVKGIAGGNALKTTAYGIPDGVFTIFFFISGPYLASKFRNIRTLIMVAYLCPTIIGTALLWKLPRTNLPALLVPYYAIGSFVASLVLALQMPSTNVAGYTKRVTATSFVFLAYCIGNIIGPHIFLAQEAPVYPTACKVIPSCASVQIAFALGLRALLKARNKKRDAVQGVLGENGVQDETMQDLTDFQSPKFRYCY